MKWLRQAVDNLLVLLGGLLVAVSIFAALLVGWQVLEGLL